MCVFARYQDRMQNNAECWVIGTHTHKHGHTRLQRSGESLYKEVILLLMMLGALVKDINTHKYTHTHSLFKAIGFYKNRKGGAFKGHLINKGLSMV